MSRIKFWHYIVVLLPLISIGAALLYRAPIGEAFAPRAGVAVDSSRLDGAALESAMLKGHNAARRLAGEQPLVWDDGLAASAELCAAKLASSEQFEHCEGGPDGVGNGENLWMGTRASYSYAEMIDSWVSEGNNLGNFDIYKDLSE